MVVRIMEVPEVGIALLISRLTDYTTQHFTGLDTIPHLCVKVRHHNGYAWFGLKIQKIGCNPNLPPRWPASIVQSMKETFLDTMTELIDVAEIDSDVDLLMRSIQNICSSTRRPVMFGVPSNEMIHINAPNNVQIEVYRNEINPVSATYGGYFLVVEYGKQSFPVLVYHHGIIVHNYLTKEAVSALVYHELTSKFPEIFTPEQGLVIPFTEIMQIPRNRNKWAKVK